MALAIVRSYTGKKRSAFKACSACSTYQRGVLMQLGFIYICMWLVLRKVCRFENLKNNLHLSAKQGKWEQICLKLSHQFESRNGIAMSHYLTSTHTYMPYVTR